MNTELPKLHTFHIPVMGTGFTIDSPIKVAKYGISSVISLVDDTLMEQMRKFYANKYGETYEPITDSDPDRRAHRVTEYLNLINRIVEKEFEQLKNSAFEKESDICKYFELLPDSSPVKGAYLKMMQLPKGLEKENAQQKLREQMRVGSIDVNIMTKLDRPRIVDGKPVYDEFSEALANLRGYAQSTLRSAIVFSAGLNQRLYSYLENFKDFYANSSGDIKKRVVLKVSDFRSSFVQSKIFAKKGIWVSEFRVESGLNCGGHAFASAGFLLGPILQEFNTKRTELYQKMKKIYLMALDDKKLPVPREVKPFKVTAQGGIGTAAEDKFLQEHYALDGTGWGSPFLLCPEAANVDNDTLKKLVDAAEGDLYLSDSSPLGIPFNNLKTSSAEEDKQRRIKTGNPGSPCIKGSLRFNDEFGEFLCQASIKYQTKKLALLKEQNLSEEEFNKQFSRITSKACICHQLGNGVLQKYGIIPDGSQPVAVCPGPNLAFFSKVLTLKELVDHIYGRINVLNNRPRLNLFLKELELNIRHLQHYLDDLVPHLNDKQQDYAEEFCKNLFDSITYYRQLFNETIESTQIFGEKALEQLEDFAARLQDIVASHHLTYQAASN
ncbi:MAG: hypothetical protein AB1650_00970 [Candidatus Omnitrophota bacterium]